MPKKAFAKRRGVGAKWRATKRRGVGAKVRERAAGGKAAARWHVKKALEHLGKAHTKMQTRTKRQGERRSAG